MVERYQPKPKSTRRVRQFRTRQKNKQAAFVASLAANVPAVAETTRLTDVRIETSPLESGVKDSPPRSLTVTFCTLVSALGLASCSAYFSISGLTAIFAGAYWPIIAMGVALEAGKLSGVAWLGRYGRDGSRSQRTSLVVLVGLLMGLNAIGVYGFLARAHIEHALAGDLAVAGRATDVDVRSQVQANTVSDLDKRIAQIDSAVEESTKRGRTLGAMSLASDQRKTRSDLVAARVREAKALASLQVEKAGIDGERKTLEADLGPVRYLATLLGANDEQAMRWFILAVALLLDPAAVVLMLAATTQHASHIQLGKTSLPVGRE
jgi:hypothetical protein